MCEAVIEKIRELPDECYPQLTRYVDALLDKAQKARERELDKAIEQSKADVAAGRFTCDLQEHLREVLSV